MPQVLDWIAQSYQSYSKPANSSRAVNMFAEIEVQDAKSSTPVPVWGCPGSSPFCTLGSSPVMGFNILDGQLYGITADAFWQINPDGGTINLGTANVSTSGISVDNNGIQIVWVDGQVGWYWSQDSGVQQIVDPNFFPSFSVTFFDTYFCFGKRGTREFYLSPQNAIIPFDPLLSATKEATSDNLLTIVNTHEQLYLFGERRTEVWYDAGNAPPTFPFQRSDGAIVQRGLIAPYATVLEDNTVFFLGDDGMFYRLSGFVPERMSNHAVEQIWQRYPTMTDCKAMVYTVFGHKMVTLTFPSGHATWVLDLATKRWHERESWDGSSADASIGRYRGNCAIYAYDRILIGDSLSGRVDQLNVNSYVDFGQPMRGMLVGPPIHSDRKRVFLNRFEIEVESGVGLPGAIGGVDVSYCANPIEMAGADAISSAGELSTAPADMTTMLLSFWVFLPDGGDPQSLIWSNQDDNTLGSHNPGLFVRVSNDDTATPQIEVRGWDASNAAVVLLQYDTSAWSGWVSVMLSIDTANQVIQLCLNDVVVTPDVETWSSSNPIANLGGHPWHLTPEVG